MHDLQLIQYKSPLTPAELSFLKQKEMKDRKQLYKIMGLLMVLCFLAPFAGAWVRALEGDELAFSMANYFLGVVFLLVFCSLAVYWTYRKFLYKVQQDIRHGSKLIDTVTITRKQYMVANNAYYFYITSAIKLSIEVSEEDYRRLHEGDEIRIEYTGYSHQYLGYIC